MTSNQASAAPSWWRRHARTIGMALLLLVAAGVTGWQSWRDRAPSAMPRLVIVLPDGQDMDTPLVRVWFDAAEEIGVKLEALGASRLLREDRGGAATAFILPDTVGRRLGDATIARLRERVQAGDRLMLVHDAGLSEIDGRYPGPRSRLSDLAGVDYALYDELNTGMLRETTVQVLPAHIRTLQIPPGKLVHGPDDQPRTSATAASAAAQEAPSVAGYIYGRLRYSSFVTRGRYDGTAMMQAEDGSLVAGARRHGAGEVLFVNLPLGLLKQRTDGMLLHSFLRHYAQDRAAMPLLAPMPEATGALVMNWHIDDGKALPALERADELGAFSQGPYSIHFTVGPDVNEPGDGKGMNLAGNAQAQAWVRRLARAGHEIGSHGGWIHNWFGARVGTMDRDAAATLIERNTSLLSQITGQPVREYSAPVGNHPGWVTGWLHGRDVRSYYFTGDTGMAPTRSYQDGRRPLADMWTYPVLSFGTHASFEEAKSDGTPEAEVAAWLTDIDAFCADHRTLRLVYFHPFGLVMYPNAFRAWLAHAGELVKQGRLRWMTMAGYTDFANRRLKVQWTLKDATRRPEAPAQHLEARHPVSLEGMTWLLPRSRYGLPTVASGQARVDQVDDQWRVVAGAGLALHLHLPVLPPSSPSNAR